MLSLSTYVRTRVVSKICPQRTLVHCEHTLTYVRIYMCTYVPMYVCFVLIMKELCVFRIA